MLAEENPFSMKSHRPQPAPSHALPNIYSKTENPKTQKPPFPPPLCASSRFVTHPHRSALIDISASGLADQNVGNDLRVMSDTSMTAPWWERVGRVVPSMDPVVKLFCVHTAPNFSQPWHWKKQNSTTSSGFVIGGRRVLTNAHSVDHHTQVKLKKRGSDTKYLATVLAIGAECDIAMLTVSDDEFWEGISPVEFGDLPALQDAVTVVGYPIGGDTISVTSGVVSRMGILLYVHVSAELLGMQIDAAINRGNSGGPVFNDKGKCVGIAFQCLQPGNAENIGYVIPVPVVMHFIEDYEKNGAYTGFPSLGIEWQKMENPVLRMAVGMSPDEKGIRVRGLKPSAQPSAPESQLLEPSDVILSFNGVNIGSDGTVPFGHGERIEFSHLVSKKYIGESAPVLVLRNFQRLAFNIILAKHKEPIPSHIEGKPPSFYIIAGFVFTVLSLPYLLSEFGNISDVPNELLDKHLHAMARSIDDQPGVVQSIDEQTVVSQVLAADINDGYEGIANKRVHTFNGMPVKNLKSLASMVENCDDKYLVFGLEYNQLVVLETKPAKAATPDILATHGIPSSMSDDLRTQESTSEGVHSMTDDLRGVERERCRLRSKDRERLTASLTGSSTA